MGYTVLYFTDLVVEKDEPYPFERAFKTAVCVKTCPSGDKSVPIDCKTNSEIENCNSVEITANRYDTSNYFGYCDPEISWDKLSERQKVDWKKILLQLRSNGIGHTLHEFREQ